MKINDSQAVLDELGGLTSVLRCRCSVRIRVAKAPACGHCGSKNVSKWGKATAMKRYMCRACDRTFNALTGTPLRTCTSAKNGSPMPARWPTASICARRQSRRGASENDVLTAGAGGGALYVEAGDDMLISGTAYDVLQGGAGSDTFKLIANWGTDTITDFTNGTDHVSMVGITNATGGTLTFANLGMGHYGSAATNDLSTYVYYNGQTLYLNNVANVTAADFVFV
jgi:Ca2+-binding RTX toxin-like protein